MSLEILALLPPIPDKQSSRWAGPGIATLAPFTLSAIERMGQSHKRESRSREKGGLV